MHSSSLIPKGDEVIQKSKFKEVPKKHDKYCFCPKCYNKDGKARIILDADWNCIIKGENIHGKKNPKDFHIISRYHILTIFDFLEIIDWYKLCRINKYFFNMYYRIAKETFPTLLIDLVRKSIQFPDIIQPNGYY